MFFLFFLFNIITSTKFDLSNLKTETNRHFYLATLDSSLNLHLIGRTCDFSTNCSDIVCTLLRDTKLGIAAVMIIPTPLFTPIACPYIKNNRKVNMISFVTLNFNTTLNSPVVCSSINECLSDACDNFDSNKEALTLAFFGYCY